MRGGNNQGGPCSRYQSGFALLLTLLLFVLAGIAAYLSVGSPGLAQRQRSRIQDARDLGNAVDTLRVYNLSDAERPGSLPCPDFDGDGTADVNCLSATDQIYVQRFPWKTLDTSRSSGRLWYAMDSDFRDNDHASNRPVNITLSGSLTIDGVSGFAALVIDPGDALQGQSGRGQSDASVTDYLDTPENTDGDEDFRTCTDTDACNDRIIGITVDELFEPVERRLLKVVERRLRMFEDTVGFFPYAAHFGDTACSKSDQALVGHVATNDGDCGSDHSLTEDDFDADGWVIQNDWLSHLVYVVDVDCTESGSGCTTPNLELDGESGMAVILAAGGAPMGSQNRPGTDIADYLDGNENINNNNVFRDTPLSLESNDVISAIDKP